MTKFRRCSTHNRKCPKISKRGLIVLIVKSIWTSFGHAPGNEKVGITQKMLRRIYYIQSLQSVAAAFIFETINFIAAMLHQKCSKFLKLRQIRLCPKTAIPQTNNEFGKRGKKKNF